MSDSIFDKVCDSRYSELLEYLESGGNPNLIYNSQENDIESGSTLIFRAVLNAQPKVLQLLISKGADVNYHIGEEQIARDALAEISE